MAENFTLSALLSEGGPVLIVLVLCSIISLIIIIERWLYFNQRQIDSDELLQKVVSKTMLSEAEQKSTEGYVLAECARFAEQSPNDSGLYDEVRNRAIAERIPEMERYLNIEATLGTVSPYIGLLGTVFGIIQAFSSLGGTQIDSHNGMGGLNQGIAQALVATAGGLLVAIPATMAYNYFRKKVSQVVLRAEVLASRFKEKLHTTQNKS